MSASLRRIVVVIAMAACACLSGSFFSQSAHADAPGDEAAQIRRAIAIRVAKGKEERGVLHYEICNLSEQTIFIDPRAFNQPETVASIRYVDPATGEIKLRGMISMWGTADGGTPRGIWRQRQDQLLALEPGATHEFGVDREKTIKSMRSSFEGLPAEGVEYTFVLGFKELVVRVGQETASDTLFETRIEASEVKITR